jgi:predicted nucleotidyltransferase
MGHRSSTRGAVQAGKIGDWGEAYWTPRGGWYLPDMNTVVQVLAEQALPILHRYGVTRAGIFGSRARGEPQVDSDLDILVDLPEGSSLLDLVGLQLDLGDALGITVDAHTYRSLHRLLRDRILDEEVRIL